MSGTTRHPWFTQVRAVEPADRVDRDGGALALVGTSVVRLSPLAVALLDACAQDWTEPAVLAEALVARFGESDGDAVDATRAVLVTLADEGLVELR